MKELNNYKYFNSNNKNIVIVGGSKEERKNFLQLIVNNLDIKENIAVIENTKEVYIKEYLKKDFYSRIECAESKPILNKEQVVSVLYLEDNYDYAVSNIISNSKYAIVACNKLNSELESYAGIIIQFK